MEYELLNIAENASIEEAEGALHKIQTEYRDDRHCSPSDCDKRLRFLILAESAFKRIQRNVASSNRTE